MQHDASEARYLRKKHAQQGIDQDEQDEQKQFGQNLEKALDVYSKKDKKKKDIESQVEYFGCMIEPFNMREEEEMGDIDGEGYFVFKRKGEYRDAWLDSIEQGNDMMVADQVKKKIKTQGNIYKGLYDDQQANNKKKDRDDAQKINEEENQEDDNEQDENVDIDNPQENQQNDSQQPQLAMSLQPTQIKQLLIQLLPMNNSANTYIRQLKKNIKDPETKELHDKILELCNMYIDKTSEYDILTSGREQLEIDLEEEGEGGEEEEVNWDVDEEEEEETDRKLNKMNTDSKRSGNNKNVNEQDMMIPQGVKRTNRKQQKQQHQSDDDIF